MKVYFEDGTSWTEPYPLWCYYKEFCPDKCKEVVWNRIQGPDEEDVLIDSPINDVYKMVIEALKKEKEKTSKHS